ncbi:MAG: alpha-amylase family glycosyl hydrolase [Anaerolineaceae bacterium]
MMQYSANDKNANWWKNGVIYQIYPRSFLDTNSDGIGDLQGVIQKLDYLNDGTDDSLGIDAIWLSPIFPSPMADFGYDVSDYCGIHPLFGDLAIFDRLIAEAHRRNIKIILDYVPNHTSDRHPWFLESCSSRENPKREWYIWRDAKTDGSLPNNWGSAFGGSAWEWDERTGQYYLHSFLKEQPELNWRNLDVKKAMLDVLRFWLERGVDGFRMDVVGMLLKDAELRDNPILDVIPDPTSPIDLYYQQQHIYDQDLNEVHAIICEIRVVLDEYAERCGIGELWYELPRWVKYYGTQGDELQLPFNFRLMKQPWNAQAIKQSVDEMEQTLPEFAWPNYVLSSHDAQRLVSRVGEGQARVAAMLLLTLRGTPTLYYGEELGMENGVISAAQMQDPQGFRLGAEYSRDYGRTPMQWTDDFYAGFSSVEPWLPLSKNFQNKNVQVEANDPTSMLALYRNLIHLRKQSPILQSGSYLPVEVEAPDCFVFERRQAGEHYLVALNISEKATRVHLPDFSKGKILLSTYLDGSNHDVTDDLELRENEGVIIKMETNMAQPG